MQYKLIGTYTTGDLSYSGNRVSSRRLIAGSSYFNIPDLSSYSDIRLEITTTANGSITTLSDKIMHLALGTLGLTLIAARSNNNTVTINKSYTFTINARPAYVVGNADSSNPVTVNKRVWMVPNGYSSGDHSLKHTELNVEAGNVTFSWYNGSDNGTCNNFTANITIKIYGR